MTRGEILDRAKEIITKDRNNQYGEPEDIFDVIAAFWDTYLGIDYLTAVDVANMMVLFKIARNVTSETKIDTFIDIAGYAACGGEIATRGELNGKADDNKTERE